MKKSKKGVSAFDKTLNIVNALSYLVQVIIAFFALFQVDIIVNNQIAALNELEQMGFDPGYIKILTDFYLNPVFRTVIILFVLVCLIFSFIGLICAWKNKIKKRKVMLIVFAIVCITLSFGFISIFYTILSIVSLILVCICKGPKVKEKNNTSEEKKNTKVKKVEIKKFKSPKTTRKTILFSILIILAYFYLGFGFYTFFIEAPWYINLLFFPVSIPTWLIIFLQSLNETVGMIAFYGLLIIMSIGFYYKEYKQMFAAFFKNFKTSIKYLFGKFGLLYAFYLPVSIIIVLIFGQSENQQVLNEIPIIISGLLALIYAPIVEETVFRGAIRKLVKNNILYIIISAISFGLIHTIGQEATLALTLIKAIPYAIIGGYLAYVYTKNGNMMYNILLHFLFNSVGVILMFIGSLA